MSISFFFKGTLNAIVGNIFSKGAEDAGTANICKGSNFSFIFLELEFYVVVKWSILPQVFKVAE